MYQNILLLAILGLMVWISYSDFKKRIIPDLAVAAIFILATGCFIINEGFKVLDYIYYIFYASIPLLALCYFIENLINKRTRIIDFFILGIAVAAGFIIVGDFKLKYVVFCMVLIITSFVASLFAKFRTEVEKDEIIQIGGGDIKLLAALGPVFRDDMLLFLILTFITSFIYLKIKKQDNIYLAPFMLFSYVLTLIFKVTGGIY